MFNAIRQLWIKKRVGDSDQRHVLESLGQYTERFRKDGVSKMTEEQIIKNKNITDVQQYILYNYEMSNQRDDSWDKIIKEVKGMEEDLREFNKENDHE